MKPLTTLLCSLLVACPALAQQAELEHGIESFDAAWKIINTQHFDADFNGVDWDAVRAELRPQAQAAEDMEGIRAVIRDMLSRLGQSHFSLIEKEFLGGGAQGAAASPAGTVGFDVRFRGGQAWVTQVEEGGPAALAGVRPGWILQAIDGKSVKELIQEAPASDTLRPDTFMRKALMPRIGGAVGSTASYRFVGSDPTNDSGAAQSPVDPGSGEMELAGVELKLIRVERDAVPFDIAGLPTFYLVLRSHRFEHKGRTIGVVHFSNWFSGISKQIDFALVAMRDCDGLVLDLRGNSGGDGMMAARVAGHFFAKREVLGIQRMRQRNMRYTIRPRLKVNGDKVEPFLGPLVILADETTGSCSEVFTGGMQALGRAHVIGERSAGAALPALLTKLPNGDYLLHAIGDFLTSKGDSMESDGVKPDLVVPLSLQDLRASRDAAMQAAASWIESQLDD